MTTKAAYSYAIHDFFLFPWRIQRGKAMEVNVESQTLILVIFYAARDIDRPLFCCGRGKKGWDFFEERYSRHLLTELIGVFRQRCYL